MILAITQSSSHNWEHCGIGDHNYSTQRRPVAELGTELRSLHSHSSALINSQNYLLIIMIMIVTQIKEINHHLFWSSYKSGIMLQETAIIAKGKVKTYRILQIFFLWHNKLGILFFSFKLNLILEISTYSFLQLKPLLG